jgi:uncharacterized protein
MESAELTLRARPTARLPIRLVTVVVAGAALAAMFFSRAGSAPLQTFMLVFVSITIEALPFVLLGAVVSGALAVLVPKRLFTAIGRLPLPLQIPCILATGAAFPVCECGSVPVARQLIRRGIHPSAGLAFMLGAPVINPIVLTTTWLAYSGRGLGFQMVIGRAALGAATAIVVGLVAGRSNFKDVLRERPGERDHAHAHGADGGRMTSMVGQVVDDFFYMGRFIVLGAALAALFQVAGSQAAASALGQQPVVAVVGMMALAFALSMCSEADAFVAASFLGVPFGAQLAFLTFGPIADFKLALLYGATFRRRTALTIVGVGAAVVLTGSLWFWMLTL